MNDDLISRQMLLEYIHGEPVGRLLCDKYNLDGLIKQFPSAQPEQRWIPCSERLPEESGDYLVTVAHHSGELLVEVDQFDNENGSWWHYMDDVIAWMPLPEPYKGEKP